MCYCYESSYYSPWVAGLGKIAEKDTYVTRDCELYGGMLAVVAAAGGLVSFWIALELFSATATAAAIATDSTPWVYYSFSFVFFTSIDYSSADSKTLSPNCKFLLFPFSIASAFLSAQALLLLFAANAIFTPTLFPSDSF